MRSFLLPMLVLFSLTMYVTNAFAEQSVHGGVVYVQIGNGDPFQVDLDSQKAVQFASSKEVDTHRFEVSEVEHREVDLDSPLFTSLNGCWRGLGPYWTPLPNQMGYGDSMVTANPEGFVIAKGVLIDTKRHMFLDGICRGIITQAITKKDVLLLARREVTGAFMKRDRVLGLQFSDNEIVARSDNRGTSPTDIIRFKGKVRALSIDPMTDNTLVVRELSTTSATLAGWLRALAGHPAQNSIYELVVREQRNSSQKVIKLTSGNSGQSVKIWF